MSPHDERPELLAQPRLFGREVEGARCPSCGRSTAPAIPRCPWCGSLTDSARFEATGVTWASTVLHIPVGGRRPPYGLAYVDLRDGPRVLVLHGREGPIPIGTIVRLVPSANPDAWAEIEEAL